MNLFDIVKMSLSVIVGYLIGSFLPGYFLPLWVRKIDIRKMGDGNPGVINVKRNAGALLAVCSALYDIPKGLLSILIIQYVFKLPSPYAYLAGFAAVMGHKFPFYLGFKGGRGIAATIGLFLYIFIKILVQDFSLTQIIPFIVYIGIFALLLSLATHGKGDFFTLSIFPIIGVFILLHLKVSPDLIFILALISIMTFEAGRNLVREKIIFHDERNAPWSTIVRPLALLFIPLGFILPKISLIIFIGCILLIFLLMDFLRITIPKAVNSSHTQTKDFLIILKGREERKIASITFLLAGIWVCFILFELNIAIASLGFVALAGVFEELIGLNCGRTRIFRTSDKTLEGWLAYLSAVVTIAFFVWSSGSLTLPVVAIGALAAVVTEAIPIRLDDNLTVSVITGAVMTFLQKGF